MIKKLSFLPHKITKEDAPRKIATKTDLLRTWTAAGGAAGHLPRWEGVLVAQQRALQATCRCPST